MTIFEAYNRRYKTGEFILGLSIPSVVLWNSNYQFPGWQDSDHFWCFQMLCAPSFAYAGFVGLIILS
ncbi:uncharacterized protein BT62DRAFT_765799 [Guyanagaster necrorhizus]|uniref:Uncharacterized protein n=1 Tax=Guyanagaster necrorhizus TaxID=856835 RepID=A0A9P8AUC7_9AGAR|nr:uncharacterized protein BT62DRAFT_765799 [Guyanagaster necrorhizus MCA 3950]KAG7448338.1 hypothetical protein BT62DRAFT_765799 [Guyanagaster necrorhizus MCA 3950]